MNAHFFAGLVSGLILLAIVGCASSRHNTTYNTEPYDYQGYHSPHQIP